MAVLFAGNDETGVVQPFSRQYDRGLPGRPVGGNWYEQRVGQDRLRPDEPLSVGNGTERAFPFGNPVPVHIGTVQVEVFLEEIGDVSRKVAPDVPSEPEEFASLRKGRKEPLLIHFVHPFRLLAEQSVFYDERIRALREGKRAFDNAVFGHERFDFPKDGREDGRRRREIVAADGAGPSRP